MMEPGDFKASELPRAVVKIGERTDALEAWRTKWVDPALQRHEQGLLGFWDATQGKRIPGMFEKVDETHDLAKSASEKAEQLDSKANKVIGWLAGIAGLLVLTLVHAYGLVDLLGKAFNGKGAP